MIESDWMPRTINLCWE